MPALPKRSGASDQDRRKLEDVLATVSKASGVEVPAKVEKLFEPVGCEKCKNLGYSGRIAVAEIMAMSPALEEMVSRFMITSEIERQAISEGMLTMTQDAAIRVVNGETSIAEAARSTEL